MRTYLVVLMALIATNSAALAEQGAFIQVAERAEAVTATVTADEPGDPITRGFSGVELKQASVTDVDANGDGYISFEELERFDVKNF